MTLRVTTKNQHIALVPLYALLIFFTRKQAIFLLNSLCSEGIQTRNGRFEAVAHHNNWTDKDKLGQLLPRLPRLQGLAGEFVFEELKPEILSNYRQLTEELGNRFGVIETEHFRQNSGVEIKRMANQLKVML